MAIDGHRLPLEFASLPYGLRLAQVTVRHPTRELSLWPGPRDRLTPLDSDGHSLPRPTPSSGPVVASRWWERPHAPAPGPCRLRAHKLPGLTSQWGHVASAVRPYDRPIIGRAFFSCIDTEYFLHHSQLNAALLLDAQHPGRPPAPLPEMKPLSGAPGVYEAPAAWQGSLTAERFPRWWLVATGGSGPAERLELLRHLSVTVPLPPR